jgi:hypothetical protein
MNQFKNYDPRIEFLKLNEKLETYDWRIERLNMKVDSLIADIAKLTAEMYEIQKVLRKMPIYANSKD